MPFTKQESNPAAAGLLIDLSGRNFFKKIKGEVHENSANPHIFKKRSL